MGSQRTCLVFLSRAELNPLKNNNHPLIARNWSECKINTPNNAITSYWRHLRHAIPVQSDLRHSFSKKSRQSSIESFRMPWRWLNNICRHPRRAKIIRFHSNRKEYQLLSHYLDDEQYLDFFLLIALKVTTHYPITAPTEHGVKNQTHLKEKTKHALGMAKNVLFQQRICKKEHEHIPSASGW